MFIKNAYFKNKSYYLCKLKCIKSLNYSIKACSEILSDN